jgi:hypothetical protein
MCVKFLGHLGAGIHALFYIRPVPRELCSKGHKNDVHERESPKIK